MSEPEKRAHPRYEVHALVDISGDRPGAPPRVRNLSLGGISLEGPDVQEVGTELDLVITFPDLDGAQLSVRGKVVWVNREPPIDMGIRFLDLDEPRQATLREFLHRVLAETIRDLAG